MLRVGLIGWRGMVGSVLMQRMREEKDFTRHRADFLLHVQRRRRRPSRSRRRRRLKDAARSARTRALRRADQLPGRRLHQGSLRPSAQERLEGLLDRRRLHAAHGRRRRHHSRSGEWRA